MTAPAQSLSAGRDDSSEAVAAAILQPPLQLSRTGSSVIIIPDRPPISPKAEACKDKEQFPDEPEQQERHIYILADQKEKFVSNELITAKYSFKNPFSPRFFIWKNLWEQFQRKAYIYFLIIACMQQVPGLSPFNKWTTAGTLMVVLFLSACKAAYEDMLRHKFDSMVNSRTVSVLRARHGSGGSKVQPEAHFEDVRWKDIQVGDIVHVSAHDPLHVGGFPCDLLLLSSTDPNGMAYVETSNLDGETNLKPRRALPCTQERGFAGEGKASTAIETLTDAMLVSEGPSKSLYTYTARLMLPALSGSQEAVSFPVGPDQLLLRGSSMRKVDGIWGLAVFTGKETRLGHFTEQAPWKVSRLEGNVNKRLLIVLALQFALCIIGAFGAGAWAAENPPEDTWYMAGETLMGGPDPGTLGFVTFWTFVILYNNLIPISLYTSMEVVKLVQGMFMEQDLCMYYPPKDMPAVARTTSINEELGQVNHIFSDKTGTLTMNVMRFFKFSAAGVLYGKGTTDIGRAAAQRRGETVVDERPPEVRDSDWPFWDSRISGGAWRSEPFAQAVSDLFLALGVCHTVLVEKRDGVASLSAESPDELALVTAAMKFGFHLLDRNEHTITLDVSTGSDSECSDAGGVHPQRQFSLKNVLEFSSERRRMGVVVREVGGSDDSIWLYSKGADSALLPILAPGQEQEAAVLQQHCDSMADDGLRTLVIARRRLPQDLWSDWNARYVKAQGTVGANRKARVEEVAAEIEKDLTLIGATAIEDRLQDQVPATIASLRRAGVRVFMLTGDKMETAENIGFACALLHTEMELVRLSQTSVDDTHAVIKAELTSRATPPRDGTRHPELAVVVTGACLEELFKGGDDSEVTRGFYDLCVLSTSVVCCRVSPGQKAQVVTLIRRHDPDTVTLAIGDGANDVVMIQAAHVGVGISGMEGQQAANTADYAIGQFKALHRLVMVHGRWNYRRLALKFNFFFYKNVQIQLANFMLQFVAGFTGTPLFDDWVYASWNVFFTALPVVVVAIIDRDVMNTDRMHSHPLLLRQSQQNLDFTGIRFSSWYFNGALQTVVCFGLPILVMSEQGNVLPDGRDYGLFHNGTLIFTLIMMVVSLKLAIEIESWSWLHHFSVWGSILFYFIFMLIYGEGSTTMVSWKMVRTQQDLFAWPAYWLILILGTVTCLVRDVAVKYCEHNVYTLLPEKELTEVINHPDSAGFLRRIFHVPIHRVMQQLDALLPNADVRVPLELRREFEDPDRGPRATCLGCAWQPGPEQG
eukprot:TRINITY_DN3222_c0_g1_i1.p1 TRINITY_DN3222_c0_g1~~TRINITY_DN3222_c0_g1_i1.p1  ORF type:complete len:1263 (+),score=432.09 TRINITY_DN3222_c0_g1_i1:226-4014(+)